MQGRSFKRFLDTQWEELVAAYAAHHQEKALEDQDEYHFAQEFLSTHARLPGAARAMLETRWHWGLVGILPATVKETHTGALQYVDLVLLLVRYMWNPDGSCDYKELRAHHASQVLHQIGLW